MADEVTIGKLREAVRRVVDYLQAEDTNYLESTADQLKGHIALDLGTLRDWLNDDPEGTHRKKLYAEWKKSR